MWATYPEFRRTRRTALWFVGGFALATVASFWVLLLEPNPLHAAHDFWKRTIPTQVERALAVLALGLAPVPRRGIPDLAWFQKVLDAVVLGGAVVLAVLPRKKSPLQLAALTGALLIGFEVVLTHWFYLYLPWFFGFVAYAVLAGEPGPPRRRSPQG